MKRLLAVIFVVNAVHAMENKITEPAAPHSQHEQSAVSLSQTVSQTTRTNENTSASTGTTVQDAVATGAARGAERGAEAMGCLIGCVSVPLKFAAKVLSYIVCCPCLCCVKLCFDDPDYGTVGGVRLRRGMNRPAPGIEIWIPG